MLYCRECSFSFDSVPDALRHQKSHGNDIRWQLEFRCFNRNCNGLFGSYLALRRHLYTHIKKKKGIKVASVNLAEIKNKPIQSQTSAIQNNTSNIQKNMSTIQNNVSNIQNNSSTIQNFPSAIQNSSSAISNNNPTIQNNSSTIQSGSSAIPNNNPTIQTNSSTIQNIPSAIQSSSSAFSNNNPTIQTNSSTIQTGISAIPNKNPAIQNNSSTIQNGSSAIPNNRTIQIHSSTDPNCPKPIIHDTSTISNATASTPINPSSIDTQNMTPQQCKVLTVQHVALLLSDPALSKQEVQNICTFTEKYVNSLPVKNAKLQILNICRRSGMDKETLQLIESYLNVITDSISELNTEEKRMKYYRNQESVIDAQSPIHVTHFDIKKIFEKLFQLPNVYDTVIKFIEEAKCSYSKDVYTSYVNGSVWRNKELKFDKTVIPISLILNEFKLGYNRMCAVQFTIPALPLDLQNDVKNSFITSIFQFKDRNTIMQALQQVIDTLQHLYQYGMQINVNGSLKRIYLCLAYIHTDNMNLEPFSYVSCNICNATKNQLISLVKEDQTLVIDTKQAHEIIDIFKYVLEHLCTFTISQILVDLICLENIFTIENLNDGILDFNFGNDLINRPPLFCIKQLQNQDLKMTSSQVLTFITYAPFIIGDLIPDEEDVKPWQLFLQLRKIVHYICTPLLSVDSMPYLEHLIAEHLDLFKQLHGPLNITQHVLTHLPSLVHKYGAPPSYTHPKCTELQIPLDESDTLHSVSQKYQMLMCNRFMNKRGFKCIGVQIILPLQCHELTDEEKSLITPPCEDYKRADFVRIGGLLYQRNSILLRSYEDDGAPNFVKVHKLIVNVKQPDKLLFVCTEMCLESYSEHYQSYEVTDSGVSVCVLFKDLHAQCPSVVSESNAKGECYVIQKH